ncbi:hypothetical protein SUGI_0686450 [Cryptomeria japonica]|nr:hypothetical protein SUGI_0686450 [Cryptomeria japonica]
MASSSQSNNGGQPHNDLKNGIQELEPCPSTFANKCLFCGFSLFEVSPSNSLSSALVTINQPTNAFEEIVPSPSTSGASAMTKKRLPYDPEDVRHAKGVFAEAFSRHEKMGRYSKEKIQEWKTALNSVSYYMGHIINNKE